MNTFFRADASLEIGTGHVMRCLALADALAASGYRATFICRDFTRNLCELIEERGYGVVKLPAAKEQSVVSPSATAHSNFLGVPQEMDAAETHTAINELGSADLLVVDHYAIDKSWETRLRPVASRILAIDDLADREHDCDVLLDHNIGADRPGRYSRLVPARAELLLGPRYALLAGGFTAWRDASLSRRQTASPRHLLVSMGGVDKPNATGEVLNALKDLDRSLIGTATVVLGAGAPWVEEVQTLASTMPFPASVMVGIDNMAEVMAASDLCIGGGGVSVLERACLGIPSVIVPIARNQETFLKEIEATGAAVVLGSVDDISARLAGAVTTLLKENPDRLSIVSQKAAQLCDGHGATRVATKIATLAS